MDDLENLSSSVEGDVNNFFKKASKVDESPVIEGSDDFFEVTDVNPPGSGGSGSGSGDNPNGDKTGGGSFAITVNGTAPTTGSDGLPVYASTVSLDCNPGHVILLVGGSANSNPIQSDGSGGNQIDHSGSFSASFPVGNENAFFGVYGQVTYKTSLVNGVRVPSGEPTSGSIVINTSANVATSFKDEWSRASDFATNSDKPLVFMFPIGVVCLQKDGINRRVFVNQLQSGDKNINHSNEADGSINIGDGFREITFCINGDPFTGFVDFRGIKKV